MKRTLKTFWYMILTGIFGYIAIVGPTLLTYYILDFIHVPHFYNLAISFITSLLFISLFVSIYNLLMQITPAIENIDHIDEKQIQERFKAIVEQYAEHREEFEQLRKQHRETIKNEDKQEQQQ